MSWWGKAIGGTVGFVMGGPLGAVLGASIGHGYDTFQEEEASGRLEANERVQAVFFTTTFSVMGHLARIDGRVSEEEAKSVRALMRRMRLSKLQRKTAANLFNRGKEADFPLDAVLDQFAKECRGRRNLVRMFFEMLLTTAMADGGLHESEKRVLYRICERVGFPLAELERMIVMMGGESKDSGLEDAYRLLGLSGNASDSELRKAYRRLIMQYHPDTLVSKGLPEEMMQFAAEKTMSIKAAYESIRRSRDRH